MSTFVHLHVHTEYSLLQSTVRVGALPEAVRARGMSAVAITDHGVLSGWVPFVHACRAAGVKPILGMELAVALDDGETAHVVLLADGEAGYRSLVRLSTLAQLHPATDRPSVTKAALADHAEGLVALSGGPEGEVGRLLVKGDLPRAAQAALWYRNVFGPDGFYLELTDHGTPEEQKLIAYSVELGRRLGLPLVATNDVRYLDEAEAPVVDVLLSIAAGTKLADPLRPRLPGRGYDLAAPEAFFGRRAWPKEALQNAVRLAERLSAHLPDGTPKLPRFPVPPEDGRDAAGLLRTLAEEGLRRRFGAPSAAARARLDHELDVIVRMGFSDYFLIVADVVAYARRRGIAVGPGRGSAAGSLVAYALGITDVDPLRYDLLFERFLNPERRSLPDIDIDFADDRREEVLAYVREKYGADRVAGIGTFGTMAARMSLRDAGRALGLSPTDIDRLAKRIPAQPGATLEAALRDDPALRAEGEKNPDIRRLFDIARRIEGLPRHVSTHAAGIVLAPEPLDGLVPLFPGAGGAVTQFPMEDLERLGLVKMDFLGLRNLSLLDRTVRSLSRAGVAEIDLRTLSLDDAETYRMLARGETDGVFQLESPGMRRLLVELRPSAFDDLVAAIALYRPGPMDQIPAYLRAKRRPEAVRYPHPALRPILEPTYGVIVYQEQIMRIAEALAGYTLGEADLLRRAVAKKDRSALEGERTRFVERAVGRGVPKAEAEAVYDLIVRFADYGFNKSHAVAYALIAYQTAYLKAHHPLYFYAELLNSVVGDADKTAAYLDATRRAGIRLLGPDINASAALFRVEGPWIRFGLLPVKNVGRQAAEAIERARADGPFRSLVDFLVRVDARAVSRRVVEALIVAGAFDALAGGRANRAKLLAGLDEAYRRADALRETAGQGALFADDGAPEEAFEAARAVDPYSPEELARLEREALGVVLGEHPLHRFMPVLRHPSVTRLAALSTHRPDERVRVAAELVAVRPRTTRRGEPMASLFLDDLTARLWAVVFPEAYRLLREALRPGALYLFRGRVLHDGEAVRLAVDDARPLDDVARRLALSAADGEGRRAVFVRVREADRVTGKLEALRRLLLDHPGESPVFLVDERRGVRMLPERYAVTPSLTFLKAARALFGPDGVALRPAPDDARRR
ncbi:MAG: DNA polymerase III alpha subunit [Hydrogenibacillus schlegelii]|uniref:DNA polymerase III subunit alpha n=1 Tax=Hydrogenibacillus schlegelii TaxID=1484 RepID=A0A2T5GCG1_HYDSH|nr:DNA polymerase III subunit alpha [Hydrogenibacillus schlegelii]PTQ53874.1 MAG: DNA polymerase III alpha subunit [Hydrogenibacillus schlegelii]